MRDRNSVPKAKLTDKNVICDTSQRGAKLNLLFSSALIDRSIRGNVFLLLRRADDFHLIHFKPSHEVDVE